MQNVDCHTHVTTPCFKVTNAAPTLDGNEADDSSSSVTTKSTQGTYDVI